MTMLLTAPRIQNVFGDKSSLIVRALLRDPQRTWTTRQLAVEGVSLGLVSAVLKDLEDSGLISRHAAGRFSYSRLISAEKLLTAWTQNYRFSKNPQAHFYSADPRLLQSIRDYLTAEKIPFALTLFSAANLVAPYVVDNGHYLYLGIPEETAENVLWRLQSRFMLIPPKAGANVHFAIPIYRSSVHRDVQMIDGYPVVSNLQLYLDLFNYSAAGAEQAKWLADKLKERGTPLA